MNKEETKTENEKKKEYLKSYKQAVIAARCVEEELREIKLSKMCPSILYDDMPHGSSGTGDLSGYAVQVSETEDKLRHARYKRIRLYTDILDKIEGLEDEIEKNVLRLKYIHFKTWEEVCVEITYEWAQTHRVHASALTNFVL